MDLRAEAYALGRDAAIGAASWVADGNSDMDSLRRVLAMIEDGDPAADDYLPARPNLSGEWADDLTPRSLMFELGLDPDSISSHYVDVAADAFEEAVAETFEEACVAEIRKWIGEVNSR